MTTQPPPATSVRRPAGEFPQPVSPWESRGLLYAEVAGALVVLALVLANSMDPGFWPTTAGAVQAQVQPAAKATLVTAASSSESSE